MSHFVAYILQFQEIIVYKIPPGGGGGSIASLRSRCAEAELHIVGSQGRTEVHILQRISKAEVWNGFQFTSLVVRPNGSAGAEFHIFGSPIKLQVW